MSDFYGLYGFYGCGAWPAWAGSYLIDRGWRGLGWLAGNRPAATHFLLLRQKKVSKEKATRLAGAPAGQPVSGGPSGGPRKLATLRQRAALIPLGPPDTGPVRTGKGEKYQYQYQYQYQANGSNVGANQPAAISAINPIATHARTTCARSTFFLKSAENSFLSVSVSVSDPDPAFAPAPPRSGWACAVSKKRDQGRALSERNAVKRVCAAPRFLLTAQVARSAAKGPRQPGRLSFAYFSLAKQRKVSRPPGETGPGTQNNQQSSRHFGETRP